MNVAVAVVIVGLVFWLGHGAGCRSAALRELAAHKGGALGALDAVTVVALVTNDPNEIRAEIKRIHDLAMQIGTEESK
jgi:hypothetical protein